MISVALIFGGRSSEHGISCVTAGGILRHIDRTRFHVVPVGITRDGRFVEVSDNPEDWAIRDGVAPHVPDGGDEIIVQPPSAVSEGTELRVVREGRLEHLAHVDVFFPLLHGPYGEDGTIQGLCDLFDMPYVGAGVLASALGQDKDFTKRVLQHAGLSVADGIVVHRDCLAREGEWESVAQRADALGYPQFVKPARAGSSFGVTKVNSKDEFEAALQEAFRHDPKVLIEAALVGREVECGVLQAGPGEPPRTTIPGEVRVGDDLEFYDYESKYFGKGTVSIDIPAAISDAEISAVREVSVRAFEALGLEGLTRVDVFVTPTGEVVVNEVNTMPGFTPISMFPVLWENMGLEYSALITELVDGALSKRVGLR